MFASGVGGARDVPEFVYPSLVVPEDSTHAYAIARHGVRREISVHVTTVRDLVRGLPKWTKIVDFDDGVTAIQAWKDDLYLLTHKDAPRNKVLVAKVGKDGISRPRTLLPEGDVVILGMSLAADALYLRMGEGGLERLERLNFGVRRLARAGVREDHLRRGLHADRHAPAAARARWCTCRDSSSRPSC